MAPHTQPWSHEDSPSTVNHNNSLSLVLEDYEVFEAEAAELSIEEVDDFSSSLLLDVENPTANGNGYVQEMCELTTLVTRNFHPVHSAHSLATTSVVTPTQHAHSAEYKLLATTSNLKLPGASPHLLYVNSQESDQTQKQNEIDRDAELLCPPLHVLTAVSHSGQTCHPTFWPEQVLAYTDAPALVNAITTDLAAIISRVNRTALTQVIPCDQAPEWTTCELTCCQADVDWLPPTTNRASITPSTSTASSGIRKQTDTDTVSLPIRIHTHHLEFPDDIPAVLYPHSGLRNKLLCGQCAFTAIYLLIVGDASMAHDHQNPSTPVHPIVEPRNSELTGHRHPDSPAIWASLVSLVPWRSGQAITGPLMSNHRRIPLASNSTVLCKRSMEQQRPVALLALVDVISDMNDNGLSTSLAILHQRLHYLPQLVVHWETA